MRALVPTAATVVLLLLPIPAAESAFPGANGRLAWKTDTDTGPEVWTARLAGRRHRKVGVLENRVPGAAEQSGLVRWSPSGRRLVYLDLAGDGIVVKTLRGRLVRKVATGALGPGLVARRAGADRRGLRLAGR